MPFDGPAPQSGLGLGLARRLLAQHNGTSILPEAGSKTFEIVVDAGGPPADLH